MEILLWNWIIKYLSIFIHKYKTLCKNYLLYYMVKSAFLTLSQTPRNSVTAQWTAKTETGVTDTSNPKPAYHSLLYKQGEETAPALVSEQQQSPLSKLGWSGCALQPRAMKMYFTLASEVLLVAELKKAG